MKSTRWTFRAVCGTACLSFAGCWTPTPYGYQAYPGYYAQPGPAYPPPGAVMSPGVTYPAPQLGPPGAPGGNWAPASPPTIAPTPAGPPPTIAPSGPGAMQQAPPTFGPSSSATFRDQMPTRTDSDAVVPPPRDLGPSPSPTPRPARPLDGPLPAPGPTPNNQNSSPFGSEGDKGSFDSSQIPIPQRGADASQSVADRGEPFESPVDRVDRGDRPESPIVAVSAKTSDARTRVTEPGRFDYDRVAYSYLRGVVDFNPRDKTWHIIYSANPDARDKYGGAFQLAESPKLKFLHDGDVVYIQGRVSPREVDASGKSKYEVVDQIDRVSHRGTQSVGN